MRPVIWSRRLPGNQTGRSISLVTMGSIWPGFFNSCRHSLLSRLFSNVFPINIPIGLKCWLITAPNVGNCKWYRKSLSQLWLQARRVPRTCVWEKATWGIASLRSRTTDDGSSNPGKYPQTASFGWIPENHWRWGDKLLPSSGCFISNCKIDHPDRIIILQKATRNPST